MVSYQTVPLSFADNSCSRFSRGNEMRLGILLASRALGVMPNEFDKRERSLLSPLAGSKRAA